jgi:hypothetical protein
MVERLFANEELYAMKDSCLQEIVVLKEFSTHLIEETLEDVMA